MNRKRIVIIGASGHGRVVDDILQQTHDTGAIVGWLDDSPSEQQSFGYPVLGGVDRLLTLRSNINGVVIAVGDNYVRRQLVTKVRRLCPDLPLVSAIHPNAVVARDVAIGAGTVIMAGAIVNPGSRVGGCCILNTNSSLGHDCEMYDYASIAPKVAVGGNSRIEECSAVSIGATIVHGVQIGEHSVIGAGAVVLDDIPACSVAYGTPARVARTRAPGERYLRREQDSLLHAVS
jgi:sugar O-acyltransferase (sialic acid O-acetyltransferase NeuD family)